MYKEEHIWILEEDEVENFEGITLELGKVPMLEEEVVEIKERKFSNEKGIVIAKHVAYLKIEKTTEYFLKETVQRVLDMKMSDIIEDFGIPEIAMTEELQNALLYC